MALENCTCSIEYDGVDLFNIILIVGFLPIMAIVGLFVNVLNTMIYMKNYGSSSRYLTALSISDFGVCLSGIFVMAADSLRPHNFYVDQLVVLSLPHLIPFGLFFQMFSIYITVMAALDCFISVSRCTKSLKTSYCTTSNTNKILLALTIFVALYNLILFGELEAVECYSHTHHGSIYELCPTEMRLDENYITIYRGYMYAIVMAFLPFALLFVLTIGIIYSMRHKRQTEPDTPKKKLAIAMEFDALNNNNKGEEKYAVSSSNVKDLHVEKSSEDDAGSPIVLVMVVVLFLLCNAISLLVNIFDMVEGLLDKNAQMALIDVGNILVVFNATANFFIYVGFSSSYRKKLKQILFSNNSKCIANV